MALFVSSYGFFLPRWATQRSDCLLCVPGPIRSITLKLGRVLSARGLMPSVRRGAVADDVAGYIRRMQGSVEWKGDKTGVIGPPLPRCATEAFGQAIT